MNLGMENKELHNSSNLIDLVFNKVWSMLYSRISNNFHYNYYINKLGSIKTPGIKTSIPFNQILSQGRLYMYKLIKKLDLLGIKTVRLVTDGLTVNKAIPKKFIGNQIGQLKLEHELLVYISYVNKDSFIQLNTNNE